MPTMNRITALIDWDTARRLASSRVTKVGHIEEVVERLQRGIRNYLLAQDRKATYRVYWRIYHGWHMGKTKTPDRLLFDKYVNSATARTIGNISFSSDFRFSGTLSCNSTRPPIVDTLRIDQETGTHRQKMVDTMLVCDLLHLARTREYALLIVVASDDDFIPALHTTEAWRMPVVMLHDRQFTNSLLSQNRLTERIAP
jgi:hypothetical protein